MSANNLDLLSKIARCRKLCSEDPQNFKYQYQLGQLLTEKKDYEGSLPPLREAIRLNPSTIDSYLLLADNYWKLGFNERAVITYDEACRQNKQDERPLINLGSIYLKRNDLQKAKYYFQQALQISDQNIFALRNLITINYLLGDYEQQLSLAKKSVEQPQATFEDWFNQGLALAKLQQPKEALASYLKAYEMGMRSVPLCSNIAVSYSAVGQYPLAEEFHQRALDQEPNNADAWYNWAEFLAEQDKKDAAIAAYEKVVKLNPDDGEAWYNLAKLIAGDNPLKTVACLEKSSKHIKEDLDFNNLAAEMQDLLGNFDKAINYRQRIQLKDPNNYANNFALGIYLLKKNNPQAAWETIKRCGGSDDIDLDAWQKIAHNFSINNIERAELFCLEIILKAKQTNPSAWLLAMDLANKRHSVLDAYEFYYKFADLLGSDPHVWLKIAYNLSHTDNKELMLDALLRVYPYFVYSQQLVRQVICLLKKHELSNKYLDSLYSKFNEDNKDVNLLAFALGLEFGGLAHLAEDLYEKVNNTNPRSILSLQSLVFYYIRHSKHSKAMTAIYNSIEFLGPSPAHWILLAEVFTSRDDLQQAHNNIAKALPIAYNMPDYWALLAVLQQKAGHPNMAMESIAKSLDLSSGNDRVFYRAALVQLHGNKANLALDNINRALNADYYNPEYWQLKSKIWDSLGKADYSRQCLLRSQLLLNSIVDQPSA